MSNVEIRISKVCDILKHPGWVAIVGVLLFSVCHVAAYAREALVLQESFLFEKPRRIVKDEVQTADNIAKTMYISLDEITRERNIHPSSCAVIF